MTQREAFFGEVVKAAYADSNIIILSADSGSSAFDQFRKDKPQQWIHMGISEANMMCVAGGLARAGKQVFTFSIIPFSTGRVFDQVKVAIALQGLPVTIVGVGAGYSYDDGGPTHYGVEDIGVMKQLKGIEIWSPSDQFTAASCAKECLDNPRFRYVRLDRHVLGTFARLQCHGGNVAVLTYGAMHETAMSLDGSKLWGIFTYLQVHPLKDIPQNYERVITLEEHFYTGGLGESVSAWMHDHGDPRPLLRLALPDCYEWENGGRQHLWQRAGLDVPTLTKRIAEWLAK